MNSLSHITPDGKASMVDVSHKPNQLRNATAEGTITLMPHTLELILQNKMKKGHVLSIAEFAGIQAAKRTSELIPLCHNIALSKVSVTAQIIPQGVKVTGQASCVGPTGVEMEALTAVNVALLTIYDMCKAVDSQMVMHNIRLLSKTKKPIE